MKKIVFILLLIFIMLQNAYSVVPRRISIDVNQVDSIEIKFTITELQTPPSCTSREHFDSIFDIGLEFCKIYQRNDSPNDWFYARVVLREPDKYTLFIKMLNSLRPLSPERVKVLPSEVRLLCPVDSVERLNNVMSGDTNDPLTTHMKYTLYFKDGSAISAFSDGSYLDYNNWRYWDAIYLYSLSYWFKYNYFKPF